MDLSVVRSELGQRYEENRRAFLAMHFAAIMALRTEEFYSVTPDGAQHDRAEMAPATRAPLDGIDRWIEITVDIDTLDVSGELARVTAREHLVRMARRSDGLVHHVEAWVTQREIWRTVSGWKMYCVDSMCDRRRLIDGQAG